MEADLGRKEGCLAQLTLAQIAEASVAVPGVHALTPLLLPHPSKLSVGFLYLSESQV